MKKPIFLLIVLCFLLSACNSGKDSPSSGHGTPGNGNTNPPEPEELPGTPRNLTATAGDRQVTLNWEAPSTVGASVITRYEYQYSTTSGTFDDTWTNVSGGGSARQVAVSGLTGSTSYFFRVRAVNTQGPGVPSTETGAIAYDRPTVEPGAPTNLRAAPGDRQVTLNWEAPSTVGASVITGYEYQYSTTSGTFDDTWTPMIGTGTTVTVSGLKGATTYFFRVRAMNAQGKGHFTSVIATSYDGPIPEPGAPTNLRAAPGDQQVTLNWEAPNAGASVITRYEYQYSTTSGIFGNTWTEVPNWASALEITIPNLTGATNYSFRVRAVNAQGTGAPSTEVEAIAYDGPIPEPGAPTNLTPTSGDRQVTLNWNAPSTVGASAITHYEYQYKTTSGTFDENTWTHVSGDGSARQVTVSSLLGATSYTFRVRAVNAQGTGAPSTEMEAIAYDGPTPEPGAPTNLTPTSGDRQVTLNWNAPSTVGASAITHYEYQYKTTSGTFDENTWTHVSGDGSARQVTVSSLLGATSYTFRVRAVNAQGTGAPSTEMEAIAYDGPTPEPGAPTNLTPTSGDRQVTLNWNAPSTVGASAITHYEYQYKTTSGTFDENTWTHVSGDGSARQVTVSSLLGATSYTFRVRAVNAQGTGAPSTEMEAITYDGPTPEPGAPTNLTPTSGDRQVTLNWNAPSTVGASAITHYEYQYSTTSGTFDNTWIEVPNGASALEITIPNLIGATSYTFRVRAVNAQGPGAPSTEMEAIAYDGPTPEPGTPTSLTPTSGDRQVTLNWNAPSTVGASAITHYEYQYSTTSGTFDENTWTEVPNGASALEITIPNLIAGTIYHFQVRAVNAQGAGIPSDASQTLHGGIINPETVCSDPATTDSALPGTGTVDNPFALCSSAHLSLIGDTVTNAAYTLSASYVMGQDINLNNEPFTPIAGSFTGTLDGRGKKIMNLTINVSGHAALFVKLGSGGNIKNLGIEEFDVTGSGRVGSLVADSFGTISHCYAVDSDEFPDVSGGANSDFVGGLVGFQRSRLTSSYATGNPEGGSGDDKVGGLVGRLSSTGSITSSYATGSPDGGDNNDHVGGLVGSQASGGTITSSYATGNPEGRSGDDYIGGLVGYQGSGSITSSYAMGSPNGGEDRDRVGGLVGYQVGGGTITSSYAMGSPKGGEDPDVVGGLVGWLTGGSITSSYATGNPEGGADYDNVGGLVGYQDDSSLTSSYGFGTTVNGGTSNTHGAPPSGVSSASALTQANSGNSDTNRWSTDAWDFGTDSQAPALKYVDSYEQGDHDSDANTAETYAYTCTSNTAFLPPVNITCGTTLLPKQLDRLCSEFKDSVPFGTGTVNDPFVLCSPTHLRLIGHAAYTLSANYVMGQDIDLNNEPFTPIGGAFTGSLDGRDKKIVNLTINVSGHAALFVKLGSGGNIKNLGIKEFDVTGSGQVGSLVADSFGTISHCYAVDSDEATDLSPGVTNSSYVGGLVGRQSGGSITSSYATGSPKGGNLYNYVGGLVGQSSGSITSSYATGNPVAGVSFNYIGGLVGWQGGGSITSSHTTGNLVGSNSADFVGGLVGYQNGGSITSSYTTGNVDGRGSNDYVGGLVGGLFSTGSITSSYATGNLKGGTGYDSVGGLVGNQEGGSSITSSYTTGSPEGGGDSDRVGGLVGRQSGGSITSSYTTGSPVGEGGADYVGGLVGNQEGGSITSSYTTGNPDGGENIDYTGGLVGGLSNTGSITSSYATGNPEGGSSNDAVGGLVGNQEGGSSITSSYATGNPDGGEGNRDRVGDLVGNPKSGSITSSYGFGTTANGERFNTEGTPPSGVISASGLTWANSGDSDINKWSTDAWSFGTSSQAPALKYVDSSTLGDHDSDDTTAETYAYTCTSNTAFLPPVNITCGTTLLPNQR